MISLTNSTVQTLAAGASMTFNTVVFQTGCSECHRANTGSVKLRSAGIYEIHFHGALASATAGAASSIALQLGGVTIPESAMTVVSVAANDANSVSCTVPVRNCCGDYDRITIVNTGTDAVTISAYPELFIKRIA